VHHRRIDLDADPLGVPQLQIRGDAERCATAATRPDTNVHLRTERLDEFDLREKTQS
jgi:hypothetical protein